MPRMAKDFKTFREGYELVAAKLDWKFQMPFLYTNDTKTENGIRSRFFSSQDFLQTGDKWQLVLHDEGENIRIQVFLSNGPILEPIQVKLAIFDDRRKAIFKKQMVTTTKQYKRNDKYSIEFVFEKKGKIAYKSQCPSINKFVPAIRCEIFWHVKLTSRLTSISSARSPVIAMDCSDGLATHLEKLFEMMLFSDVVFNIRGREFPAHKNILAARSDVFSAMFQHPTKENSTNQVQIEDIEPEVFQELLRFIYTGRLNSTTMETMAAGLLIAADKYVLDELREECENYLFLQMSPENCVELILFGDLLNPPEHMENVMDEAAKCFRRLQSEVMATAKWEKMEEENPRLLLKVQKNLLSQKV